METLMSEENEWNIVTAPANTIQIQYKTYNAPYVTKMLFMGADCLHSVTITRFT